MKRFFFALAFLLAAVLGFCAMQGAGGLWKVALAAENEEGYASSGQSEEEGTEEAQGIQLIVNGSLLDTSSLPLPAREKNGVWLVPLRLVAEALGYTVVWDGLLGEAVVEGPVQQARFHPGEYIAQFTGKLQNIGLSGPEEMAAAPVLLAGRLYVPVTAFERFFNEVTYGSVSIEIAVQRAMLAE